MRPHAMCAAPLSSGAATIPQDVKQDLLRRISKFVDDNQN